MSVPRISFCIPTYNFGPFIRETLDSIARQATDEIDIVVVDGASTDDTESVVRRFQDQFPRLTYYRREQNVGVDRDIAKAVELSNGEFCWLFSSDDTLKPGALNRMLQEINEGHEIYLCNRTLCDKNLIPERDQYWLDASYSDHRFDLTERADLLEYVQAACSLGALFSFISTILVKRERWVETGTVEEFIGSHYAHVFRLFSIKKPCTLKYVQQSLVWCRSDNDSFSSRGRAHRLRIDLDSYEKIALRLFHSDSEVRHAFLDVMRREHPWGCWASLRNEINDPELWVELKKKLRAFGYRESEIALASVLGAPPMSMAWTIWHALKRVSKSLYR
jgi:abequosyltransferase